MTYQELLEKFAQHAASEEDTAIFWDRLQTSTPEEAIELMEQYETMLQSVKDVGPVDERLLQEMQYRIAHWEPKKKVYQLRSYWAAAAVLLVLSIGAYFWIGSTKNSPGVSLAAMADINPGKEGAILTLEDGSQVVLDSLENGLVAAQSGVQVLLRNGQLTYSPAGTASAETMYNTMHTPKGRQFNMVLPDGTRVWLNAASSIRYPTVFSAKERKVEITGEAYFEVAKNRSKPFLVIAKDGIEVDVLGTQFNINAYSNEAVVRTTLLEGSVRVKTGLFKKILQPNEQAVISNTNMEIINVHTEDAIAWKNGLFHFNGVDLKTLMRQLERWYDIEVQYEGAISKETFRGEIQRHLTLGQILETLKDLNIKFRLEGRTLILE